MATTLNLPYVRFIRQVVTGPGSNPQFVALMTEGLASLKVAPWKQATADLATVAMPSNDPLNFTLDDKYDAFKASKTTAASGVQSCNLGMAAYRFKIPADAISGSHYVQSVVSTIGADKFAYSGVKVALVLSDAATPPTDWTLLRTGGLASTVDTTKKFATYDANPEVYGVLNSRAQASVSAATNKAEAFTFDLTAVSTNYAYLYVVVSMFDYTDYRANRQYWIEGSTIINGDSLAVTFEGTVAADTDGTVWYAGSRTNESMSDPLDARITNWGQVVVTNPGVIMTGTEDATEQHIRWSSVLSAFCTNLPTMSDSTLIGGAYPIGGYLQIAEDLTMYSVAGLRLYAVPPLHSCITSMQIDNAITAPSSGMTIGYTLYQIFGMGNLESISALSDTVYKNINFWRGRLTSLTFGNASYTALPIFSRITDSAIAADTNIDVTIQACDTPSILLLATYVYDIQASPGAADSTAYGAINTASVIKLQR